MFGAAGVLFVTAGPDGPLVMLQLRSMFSHEGGTWSVSGGALDEGESPYEGAMREAGEEVGTPTGEHRLVGEYVFRPADDWHYTTVVVEVDAPFGRSLNFETDEVDWVSPREVDRRPLHPGFRAAWPHLKTILEDSRQ